MKELKDKKSIGVIGGAGPMAGSLMIEHLIKVCQEKYSCKNDSDFPKIVLLSVPFVQMLEIPKLGIYQDKVSQQLEKSIDELKSLSVNKIGIACNTLHGFIKTSNYQGLLNMVELTDKHLQEANVACPLVLGTSTSIIKEVHNFNNIVHPERSFQLEIDEIIDQVLLGNLSKDLSKRLDGIINRCIQDNSKIDTIVLACTELSVLKRQEHEFEGRDGNFMAPIKYVDPLRILAMELCWQTFES